MYNLEFSRKAARYYQKAEKVIVKRLNLAFSKLATDPFQQYNIKKLSGKLKGSYRLRVICGLSTPWIMKKISYILRTSDLEAMSIKPD